ncbi:DUF692 domain-containing protein [Lacibacterium aquatile]|uniref:UPF0276 protein ACFSM5_01545 n=1 Tax=Lacibacterium aquatile TaxID=1168082 RepID=A0ABW5DKA8_9PROT
MARSDVSTLNGPRPFSVSQPPWPIPARAGIGLREPHMADFLAQKCPAAWVEVHSENYLAPGGPRIERLERVRERVPVSCHGVGLSLGSADGLDPEHLLRLRALFDRLEPALISDHLSWSVAGGVYLNDLLPLPYTAESLKVVASNIDHAQDAFGRPLLVENPSAYVELPGAEMTEAEFLAELVQRTGCELLLDLNNIHVSAFNLGRPVDDFLRGLPFHAVSEIHLAGHATVEFEGETVLLDDHGSAVPPAVWELYERLIAAMGPRPTLIEWDTKLPRIDVLLQQAAYADIVLQVRHAY